MKPATCLTLAMLCVAGGLSAEVRVEGLAAQNSYLLEFDGTTLSGPGWEFLLAATVKAQFIGLAEPHNAREVPLFASALLKELHQKRGFDYLVLEQGPHIVELLARAARQADPNRLLAMARRYPEAPHFRTDQELTMLADAARLPDGPIQRGGSEAVSWAPLVPISTLSRQGATHLTGYLFQPQRRRQDVDHRRHT